MNSFPFISHHLFVSAAGHEDRAQVRPARSQNHGQTPTRRVTAREVPAKNMVEPEGPRQLELLAGLVGAG